MKKYTVLILHCTNCADHTISENHSAELFETKANEMYATIMEAVPEVDIVFNKVPISQKKSYQIMQFGKDVGSFVELLTPLGAFEIYMDGQPVYSKYVNNEWPDPAKVAQRIKWMVGQKEKGKKVKANFGHDLKLKPNRLKKYANPISPKNEKKA